MLEHGDANPLAVWGLRRVEHIPPHFTRVEFQLLVLEKNITDWIWTNLSGRFYFGEVYHAQAHDGDGVFMVASHCAAFEIPAEASVFSMLLNTINITEYIVF